MRIGEQGKIFCNAVVHIVEREERTGYPIKVEVTFPDPEAEVIFGGTGIMAKWFEKAETFLKHFPEVADKIKTQNAIEFEFYSYDNRIQISKKGTVRLEW